MMAERPTEETRLTMSQNDSSFLGAQQISSRCNPYYYTGEAFGADEETKYYGAAGEPNLTMSSQRDSSR